MFHLQKGLRNRHLICWITDWRFVVRVFVKKNFPPHSSPPSSLILVFLLPLEGWGATQTFSLAYDIVVVAGNWSAIVRSFVLIAALFLVTVYPIE